MQGLSGTSEINLLSRPLVISFQMVMGDVSANGLAKMILSERNDPVETLVFYRTNKPLRLTHPAKVNARTAIGGTA